RHTTDRRRRQMASLPVGGIGAENEAEAEMTSHLSREQSSRLLAGDGTSAEEQHAGSCAECERELSRLQEILLAFSLSVQHWAEALGSTCVPDTEFLRDRSSARRLG